MCAVDLLRFVVLAVAIILKFEGSWVLFDGVLLCEQSSIDFMCPNETIITDVNISTPTSPVNDNVCTSNFNTGITSHNVTPSHQCIGNRSCSIDGRDIDFTQIPVQTWKLIIDFTCDDVDDSSDSNDKRPRIVCPNNLQSVKCGAGYRRVNIVSTKLETKISNCIPKHESLCANVIENRTKSQCNGLRQCKEIKTSLDDWNNCIRIHRHVYVSFLCLAADQIIYVPQKDDKTNSDITKGIVVGVISCFAVIGLIAAVYMYFIRNHKHKQPAHITNDTLDYVGNQSVAFHSNEQLSLQTRQEKATQEQNYKQTVSDSTSQTRQDNEYEYADSVVNGLQHIQLGHNYLELESNPVYANLKDKKQQNEHEGIANARQPEENIEYKEDGDTYEYNGDYDKIIRTDKRRDDTSDKFKSGDHVYSHTVDDEYDTAQISTDITKNQNYDQVVLDGDKQY